MTRRRAAVALLAALTCAVTFGLYTLAEYRVSAQPALRSITAVKAEECYACHAEIQTLHAGGKHAGVNCAECHDGLDKHLADPAAAPVTRMEHAVCGGCHREQYDSFVAVELQSRAKLEKASYRSRSPLFDKLIAPHGFSKEHAEPRSHVFMLVDQLIVDRGYGGRFQLKDWRRILDAKSAEQNAWNALVDREPATAEQKTFLPQTATAANPVCFNCKSQDHILKWKYMGDPDPSAAWSRTSKVIEMGRDLKHPMNCFMCHDPHAARPRVVRDALINAVVDRGEGTYPYDKAKSQQTTITKVMFRDFRAIGLLNRPDSNLMCAQCHVEYNCNPGFDPKTGQPITMADRRTNFFPWANVLDVQQRYEQIGFKDFRHAITGAPLTKLQHPETETFWGSTHERRGVECKDCHMPKVTAQGKAYTWHGQRSARYMKKDTCERCHPSWSDAEAEYQIDAVQNYIRGKITKAEFWLAQLIDAYEEARSAGAPEAVLQRARGLHDSAHILWEWWTAENSDGFHNPALARESLTRSVTLSQEGVALLKKAAAEARPTR